MADLNASQSVFPLGWRALRWRVARPLGLAARPGRERRPGQRLTGNERAKRTLDPSTRIPLTRRSPTTCRLSVASEAEWCGPRALPHLVLGQAAAGVRPSASRQFWRLSAMDSCSPRPERASTYDDS